MKQGYVLVQKQLVNTSFYKDSYAVHLAIHLIIRANFTNTKVIFNNQEITLKIGQLITGRHSLHKETGMKPSTIRNKLKLLETVGFIKIDSNNKYSTITVNKYEHFQFLSKKAQNRTAGRTADRTGDLLTVESKKEDSKKDSKWDSQRTARGQPEDTDNTYNTYNTNNTKDKNIYVGKPAKPQHPKEPLQRDPRVTICREYWYEQTEAILHHPYPKNYKKDSSVWKYFLKIYNSVAWAKGLTDFYLKWDNDFVKKCGHSLEAFIKTLPSMLELGIHKSHWVKKHEQKGLEPAAETIKKLFPKGI